MVQARLITEIGTRGYLRVYWGENCVNCCGRKGTGFHNAQVLLGTSPRKADWENWGKPSDYKLEMWPKMCDHCPALVPPDWKKAGFDSGLCDTRGDVVNYQVFKTRNYSSPSGNPEVGDLYYITWYPCWEKKENCLYWDNCDGKHLYAMCPGGGIWDIMGRCNNCTLPQDRTHRCWVVQGVPPNITVGKGGPTCSAGAGSIQTHNWHGFLQNGRFTP